MKTGYGKKKKKIKKDTEVVKTSEKIDNTLFLFYLNYDS